MTRRRTWALTWLVSIAVLGLSGPAFAQPRPALKIGVTLHPYFSWTRNVVGALPGYEVRSILPGEIDAGDYQPRPEDIKKLTDLDAIVVNGIGHDDFIFPMIKASGNKKIVVIRPERGDAADQVGARQPASTRTPSSRSRTPFSRPTRSRRRSRRCARGRRGAAAECRRVRPAACA